MNPAYFLYIYIVPTLLSTKLIIIIIMHYENMAKKLENKQWGLVPL